MRRLHHSRHQLQQHAAGLNDSLRDWDECHCGTWFAAGSCTPKHLRVLTVGIALVFVQHIKIHSQFGTIWNNFRIPRQAYCSTNVNHGPFRSNSQGRTTGADHANHLGHKDAKREETFLQVNAIEECDHTSQGITCSFQRIVSVHVWFWFAALTFLSLFLYLHDSLCLSVCMPPCLPPFLSSLSPLRSLSLSLFFCLSLSIYIYVYLRIYASMNLCIYLSIHQSIYPCIHLSIYRSTDLSIYRSFDLSIYLSIYLSFHLSIIIYLSI